MARIIAKYFYVTFALIPLTVAAASQPKAIDVPSSLREKLKSFEPSAAIYLRDLGLHLLTSDDTDKKDSPLLFLMGGEGQVDKKPIRLEGIGKMTDMESLSQDDQFLYVMSSQGLNKSGKEKVERNQFVRARREGRSIEAQDIIELRPLLLDALKNSRDPDLRSIRSRLVAELDVESHFVREGELFIGIKNPQPSPGVGLIVSLGSVDKLFREQSLSAADVKVAYKIDFRSVSQKDDVLSDLSVDGNRFILSTTRESAGGALWTYDLAGGHQLSLIEEFSQERPEGITSNSQGNSFTVVFDQGEEEALYTKRNL